MPRTSVKGQVLVNLVVEFTESPLKEKVEKQNMDGKLVCVVSLQEPLPWRVHVDRVTNQRGSGVEVVIISFENIIIEKFLKLDFLATNNEAEYEALLVGMAMVLRMGGKIVKMFSDSRLVVGQVEGELEARDLRI